jgi:hypothetical protein
MTVRQLLQRYVPGLGGFIGPLLGLFVSDGQSFNLDDPVRLDVAIMRGRVLVELTVGAESWQWSGDEICNVVNGGPDEGCRGGPGDGVDVAGAGNHHPD